MRLRPKLIISMIVVSMVPVIAIGWVSFSHSRAMIMDSTLDGLNIFAGAKESELLLYLEQLKTRTKDFSSDGLIKKKLQEINQQGRTPAVSEAISRHLLKSKQPLDDLIEIVDVLDIQGTVVASTDKNRLGRDLSSKNYFKNALNGFYITDFHPYDNHVRIGISMAVKSFTQDQKTVGVLVNHFRADTINKLMKASLALELGALTQSRGLGETGEIYLVNQENMMITESLFVENAPFRQRVDTYPVRQCLEGNKEVVGRWLDYRGEDILGASMCITIGNFRWALIAEQDTNEALEKIGQLKNTSILIALIAFIFIGGFVVFISSWITNPLHRFTDLANQMAEGNLKVRSKIKGRNDEVGILSRAFNLMADKLESTLDSLNKEKDKLESAISERTEELSRSLKSAETLRDKAEEAAKVKSRFLANMSHEIRTPMNSILGFSALLRKTPLNEKQKDYLGTVSNGGNLLIGIIDDILDVSKLESGKITLEVKSFNLESLIMDVFKMIVARMKEKPFDTYIEIADDVPKEVEGDQTRLKQVLVNLLGNAVKFTSEGSIGVIVKLEENSQIKNNLYQLRFTVKDTGIGIPENKVDAIFESFTQADATTTRKYGGTGLGLTISKAIIEAMGGEIWIESEEGKGSEFIFSVPLKKGDLSGQEEEEQKFKHPFKDKKVFIVDDNQIARKIINKCCEALGLVVIGIADSPQAALHKLDKIVSSKGIIPDLILCDIMMQGMDGYELVRKMKRIGDLKNTKCLAVTADLNASTSKESTEELFDGYITKPVNTKELLAAFKEALNIKGEKEKKAEEEESCAGIKALVVEDADTNRMLIEVYFDEMGCTGDYAVNGKEAVEKVKRNQYDLVLMDLQMPVMGGIEATEMIRKNISKDLPIIALTAAVLKEDRGKAEKAGMTDFLAKPIDMVKLREKILQYGRKKYCG